MSYRLGVDAGGTFTDFVLADNEGNIHLFKATSTPEDGTLAMADGFAQIAEKMGKPMRAILEDTELCVNGTTVALNALIQHKGVKVGLVCTAGHEDSLEIRLGHKEEGTRPADSGDRALAKRGGVHAARAQPALQTRTVPAGVQRRAL
jgi:N-methylhydantoinase A